MRDSWKSWKRLACREETTEKGKNHMKAERKLGRYQLREEQGETMELSW